MTSRSSCSPAAWDSRPRPPPEVLESLGLTPDVLERFEEIWRGLQEDHLTRSTDSTLVVAENSPHYIYFEEPELVVAAVQDLVEAAQ